MGGIFLECLSLLEHHHKTFINENCQELTFSVFLTAAKKKKKQCKKIRKAMIT